MNHIFARIKGPRNKPYFKLISNHTLYNTATPDVNYCAPYSPDHNLDEDNWFKIESFSKENYCIKLIKDPFDSKDFNDLSKDKFSKISFIFSTQGDDFYFQKINPSLFISKKIIAFGEVAAIEESSNRIIVNNNPDAIYFKAIDTLIFKNLSTISSIFDGIDMLFNEATKEEVNLFLGESFIKLSLNYGVELVSKPNRKRIALAMATLGKMTADDKKSMLSYINGYCQDKLKLDAGSGKFEISKDDELKLLLYGIEQRFYTTPFGQEKRLANSIQSIG